MRRFSILGLMGFVLFVCVGLAALRNASELWAGIMLLVAFGATGTALLGAIYQKGNDRAWWVGSAVFSGGYLTLAFATLSADQIQPNLGTTRVLDYVHFQVTGRAVPLKGDVRALQAERIEMSNKLTQARNRVRNSYDPTIVGLAKKLSALDSRIASLQGYPTPSSPTTSATSSPAPASTNRWQSTLPGAANYDQFLRVGHSLFAVVAGWMGAWIACRFHRKQEGRSVADVRLGAGLLETGGA